MELVDPPICGDTCNCQLHRIYRMSHGYPKPACSKNISKRCVSSFSYPIKQFRKSKHYKAIK